MGNIFETFCVFISRKGKVIDMELNANVFGTFIKVDKGSEAMITLLQDFYEKHYEVQASPAEIVTDAIFDMFIRTLHEQTQ